MYDKLSAPYLSEEMMMLFNTPPATAPNGLVRWSISAADNTMITSHHTSSGNGCEGV